MYQVCVQGYESGRRYAEAGEAVEDARQCLRTLPPVQGCEVRAEVVETATGRLIWTGWRILSAVECVERREAAGLGESTPPAWWWAEHHGAPRTVAEALARSAEGWEASTPAGMLQRAKVAAEADQWEHAAELAAAAAEELRREALRRRAEAGEVVA